MGLLHPGCSLSVGKFFMFELLLYWAHIRKIIKDFKGEIGKSSTNDKIRKDHSDGLGLGYKKLSASPTPQGRQMGRRQQRTITDLTLDSKLRNMIKRGFWGYTRHVYRNEVAETQ